MFRLLGLTTVEVHNALRAHLGLSAHLATEKDRFVVEGANGAVLRGLQRRHPQLRERDRVLRGRYQVLRGEISTIKRVSNQDITPPDTPPPRVNYYKYVPSPGLAILDGPHAAVEACGGVVPPEC